MAVAGLVVARQLNDRYKVSRNLLRDDNIRYKQHSSIGNKYDG